VFVVNRRFLSQLKVLGETVSVKLAPPILLLPKGGWSFLKARGPVHTRRILLPGLTRLSQFNSRNEISNEFDDVASNICQIPPLGGVLATS